MIGDPLIFFRTVGVIVPREYLQCLLSADSLAERYGMDGIPHGQSSLVYSKRLAGTSWDVQRPALLDAADQPKRSGTLVVQDGEVGDEDGDGATAGADQYLLLAIEDGPDNWDAPSDPDEGGHDGDDDDPLAPPGPIQPDPAAEPRVELPPPLPPPPGYPPAEVAMPDEDDHAVAVAELAGHWGAFTFSAKRLGMAGAGKHGGIQADCLFHAKNSTSGCRKFLSFQGRTAAHRHDTVMAWKFWCVQALS